jgi:hypothetical protein
MDRDVAARLLGIASDATEDQARWAYRRLATRKLLLVSLLKQLYQ